jgi:hypothetical protein
MITSICISSGSRGTSIIIRRNNGDARTYKVRHGNRVSRIYSLMLYATIDYTVAHSFMASENGMSLTWYRKE